MHQAADPHRYPGLSHTVLACIEKALFPFLLFISITVTSLSAQGRAAIRRVPPIYPPIARQMGVTGNVIVTTTVDASGKVIKAESTSGNKLLSTAAIDSVKQWKFAPGDGTDTFPVIVSFEKN